VGAGVGIGVGVGVAVGAGLGVTTGVPAAVGDVVTVTLEQPATAKTTEISPHATGQKARCLILGLFSRFTDTAPWYAPRSLSVSRPRSAARLVRPRPQSSAGVLLGFFEELGMESLVQAD
jgi:hypothetical protein